MFECQKVAFKHVIQERLVAWIEDHKSFHKTKHGITNKSITSIIQYSSSRRSFTYWNHLDHVVLIHSLVITMVLLMVSSQFAWPFYACIASSNMLRSNSCSPIQCGTFSSHAYITWDEKYSDRFPIKMIDQFQSLQIIPKMWKISRFVYTLKTGKSWITMLLVNFKVSLPSEIKN